MFGLVTHCCYQWHNTFATNWSQNIPKQGNKANLQKWVFLLKSVLGDKLQLNLSALDSESFSLYWYARSPRLTFSFPVSQGGKTSVAAMLPVKLRHQGFVGISHQKDAAAVERFNLFLAALMYLHADRLSALPVVLLPFKTCGATAVNAQLARHNLQHICAWAFFFFSKKLNVGSCLYCKAKCQSNSCRCRSRWPARSGDVSRCCRIRENWPRPPAPW